MQPKYIMRPIKGIYLYKAGCLSVSASVRYVFFNQVLNSVSQLWDLIEIWGFREDIKDIIADGDGDDDDDKDSNDDKGISALGLDRDMGFSRGHQ